jgi:hypothetical protein
MFLRNASQILSVWEPLCKHATCIWIYFAHAYGLDPGFFKAEIKTANARKE